MTSAPAELAATLKGAVAAGRDRLLRDLEALVALDAPNGDPEGLRPTEELLAGWLAELGAAVVRHPSPAGTHLEARLGAAGSRPVAILAHYDTVWPRGTAVARPLRLGDGALYGPGVYDMRGGLAAALAAARALLSLGELGRPLVLLLNADEESGSVTSRELVTRIGREARAALIPEPPLPSGGLKTARKGVVVYRLDVAGRAAHAGNDPSLGVSAVHELAELVIRVRGLAGPEAGTTVNVGVIRGGSQPNVVAEFASAEVDVRVTSLAEFQRVEETVAALRPAHEGASLTVTCLSERPPMERTAAIARVAAQARRIASLLGLELGEGSAGGASDGNFLAPLGVAVVDGLGPEGAGAHALHEHIQVRSLEERAALLALLAALL